MKETISYFNGTFQNTADIAIPIEGHELGLIRGISIFTSALVKGNTILFEDDHINRLVTQAKSLNLPIPNAGTLKKLAKTTIQKNRENGITDNLNLKWMLIGNDSPPDILKPEKEATLLIWISPVKPKPTEGGIFLKSVIHQRLWPAIKLTHYSGSYMAHHEAVLPAKADFPLFIDPKTGSILEGSTFNFFWVKDGTLHTPPIDGKILEGITRKQTLLAAQKLNIPIKETQATLEDIQNCSEAFITSSIRLIAPVKQIDDLHLSNIPGPIATKLLDQLES